MLKPMLARGELHTIGATTLDEYRKHIEKDAALERRFQPVHGRRADRRGHDQHPARPARALRDPPRREVQGLGARGGRRALAPLHHRPVPARQGDRSGRRSGGAAAHGDRLDAGRARRGRAPHHAARDRARGAAQGDGQGVAGAAARSSRRSWPTSRRSRTRLPRTGSRRRRRSRRVAQAEGGARAGPHRDRAARSAAGDYAKASELQYGRLPELERQIQRAGSAARRAAEGPADAQGGSRRGGHRRGRQPLDGHSGQPADGRRNPEAAQHGRAAAPARRRPGRSDPRGRQRHPPRPRRAAGSRTVRSAASSSSARPASARPSWRARWPSSCSTTSTR